MDADGRLYDPALRALILDMASGENLAALEAAAALKVAAKQMHDQLERIAKRSGLSESRLRVLMRLYHCPGRSEALGDLAERLGVVPRTMTEIVDNLERDGLVQRVPDPDDRRSIRAVLSERGRRLFGELRETTLGFQVAVMQELDQEQLANLRDLCLRMVQGFAKQRIRDVEADTNGSR